jgi:uncharacterized membrane protein
MIPMEFPCNPPRQSRRLPIGVAVDARAPDLRWSEVMLEILTRVKPFFGRVLESATHRRQVRLRPFPDVLEGRALMASFQGLGIPVESSSNPPVALAVSADGTVVVGSATFDPTDEAEPYRWTQATGMVRLLGPSGKVISGAATGVSGDGSVIVGSNGGAFRWTASTGAVVLNPSAANPLDTASAISEDGSVIVGTKEVEPHTVFSSYDGYALSGTTLTTVPPDPGGDNNGQPSAVSANGSVVVGGYFRSFDEAFRYENGVVTPLTQYFDSGARAVSADGSVVVGDYNNNSLDEGFMWTAQGASVLPLPSGYVTSDAAGVSGDGSTIVGTMSTSSTNGVLANLAFDRPFIWNEADGTQDLQNLLTTSFGLGPALKGWILGMVTAVTPDGQTIVGYGINPQEQQEAWIVHLNTTTTVLTPNVGLVSSTNDSTYGQPVTFTAAVTPTTSGLPTPTGAVTFEDGSTKIGSSPLNASGDATLTISTLTVGTHSITAIYGGDSNFSGNTSSPVTQVVNRASSLPELAMVSAALTPDGQDVNATYSISGAPLAVPGAISLYWASGPASADEIGNAVVVPTQTAVGTYAVSVPLTSLGAQPRSATYILAVANSPSTDPDHELVWTASPSNPGGGGASGSQGGVIHATRTALKARPSPANSGQLIGLTATVKRLDRKGGTPGGSVTFLDGTAVLGTVTLRGGRASLTVSSLHVGRNPIRVDYTPDNGFAPSAETIVEIVRPHRPRGKEVSARDAVMPARSESSAASRTTVKGPAIPADAAPASAAPAFLGPLALDEKRAARAAATRPERTTPAVASNSVPIDPLLREQAINQSVQAAAKTPETLLGRG